MCVGCDGVHGSVQTSRVFPHQTGKAVSLWTWLVVVMLKQQKGLFSQNYMHTVDGTKGPKPGKRTLICGVHINRNSTITCISFYLSLSLSPEILTLKEVFQIASNGKLVLLLCTAIIILYPFIFFFGRINVHHKFPKSQGVIVQLTNPEPHPSLATVARLNYVFKYNYCLIKYPSKLQKLIISVLQWGLKPPCAYSNNVHLTSACSSGGVIWVNWDKVIKVASYLYGWLRFYLPTSGLLLCKLFFFFDSWCKCFDKI